MRAAPTTGGDEDAMRSDHAIRRTVSVSPSPVSCMPAVIDMTVDEGSLESVCRPADFGKSLSLCHEMADHSPAARAVRDRLAAERWIVSLGDLHSGGYHIDPAARRIVLDSFSLADQALVGSVYFRNALLLNFVCALRDADHETRLTDAARVYMPEHNLMIERVRAADTLVFAVQAAWEIRGAGFADLWRHFLGSPDGDMALVFTRYLERSPSALFDGTALAYAFRQWYADPARVAACDHATLESFDDLLDADLDTVAAPFGQAILQPRDVESLAVLPDGIAYLAGLGGTILSDPFFAGMNDPINQTHLFHLMYDLEVTIVNNVPFRDKSLARSIFPGKV